MKRYIKSSLSMYNSEDVDEIIKNFDPYVADVDVDSIYVRDALIKDKNSDFSVWMRCHFDYDWCMDDVDYESDPDNPVIDIIMDDFSVQEKIDNALYEAENLI